MNFLYQNFDRDIKCDLLFCDILNLKQRGIISKNWLRKSLDHLKIFEISSGELT